MTFNYSNLSFYNSLISHTVPFFFPLSSCFFFSQTIWDFFIFLKWIIFVSLSWQKLKWISKLHQVAAPSILLEEVIFPALGSSGKCVRGVVGKFNPQSNKPKQHASSGLVFSGQKRLENNDWFQWLHLLSALTLTLFIVRCNERNLEICFEVQFI